VSVGGQNSYFLKLHCFIFRANAEPSLQKFLGIDRKKLGQGLLSRENLPIAAYGIFILVIGWIFALSWFAVHDGINMPVYRVLRQRGLYVYFFLEVTFRCIVVICEKNRSGG